MAVNKVVYGNNTLIDLTSDTVTADKLAQGYTAHDASGAAITGTMSGGGSVLPSAYQQVEYIEATGTQYIDTGLLPTENNVAEIDFELTGYVNSSYIAIVSASTHMYLVHLAHSSGSNIHFVPCWNTYSAGDRFVPLSLNARCKATCFSGNAGTIIGMAVSTDGKMTSASGGNQTYTPTNNYFIFARNNGGGAVSYQAKAKLYGLTLYTNGVKQREFYPCYRKSDDEIGLYDVVNDVFYTNSGTGTFERGNNL